MEAPQPKNIPKLCNFFGLLKYYHRFLQDLAKTLHPLNKLLQNGIKFFWSSVCQTAFKKVKNLVEFDQVLTHYDPNLSVCLESDASPNCIGAVLSHILTTSKERPIAFA